MERCNAKADLFQRLPAAIIKIIISLCTNNKSLACTCKLLRSLVSTVSNETNSPADSSSRYKISPDKADAMIVQSISMLDELDKELNTYTMRVKEWYGWHFPELAKIVSDSIQYVKVVKQLGLRSQIKEADLTGVIEKSVADQIRDFAEVSMGVDDIKQEDLVHIIQICDQVLDVSAYRDQLCEYIKNRMHAIAPNLTELVGEIVGARLIAQSGGLLNLAKQPASTVQILGAEKALFRALKTKQQTPKYGLIYHASMVDQKSSQHNGKISRVLANKAALATRIDALGEQYTKPTEVEDVKNNDTPAQGSSDDTGNTDLDATMSEEKEIESVLDEEKSTSKKYKYNYD
eukprot:TRINITY_DN3061_c0_g1_i1.p1 TRINITY_DN3061_c0_g1~~TRINITY_DN3061_c0_g1_i1.p1  ORF type:complete len:347 (-),score=117.68 TRINITY_DN3061_c0_g1_i1:33-1073(-)